MRLFASVRCCLQRPAPRGQSQKSRSFPDPAVSISVLVVMSPPFLTNAIVRLKLHTAGTGWLFFLYIIYYTLCGAENTHNFLYESAEVLMHPTLPQSPHSIYVLGAAAVRPLVQLGGDLCAPQPLFCVWHNRRCRASPAHSHMLIGTCQTVQPLFKFVTSSPPPSRRCTFSATRKLRAVVERAVAIDSA